MPTNMTLAPALAPALPSASSALALMNGEPGALPLVLMHTGLRAGIIATGLFVASQITDFRLPARQVVKTALVSSLAIETFVLLWAGYQKGLASAGGPQTAPRVPPTGRVQT